MTEANPTARAVITAGFLLFLFGLLTGLVVPLLHLPRMGLSSHLEGVMNGTFLIAMGAVWRNFVLPAWAEAAMALCAVYGTYANWAATLLSAAAGAAAMMPIAGQGSTAGAFEEMMVSLLLLSLTVAMIATCVFAIWGLWVGRNVKSPLS